MDVDVLAEHNLHFADTYHLLRKERLNGKLPCLLGSKLSMESLLQRLYPNERFHGQHRALADVQFMIQIFIECPEIEKIFDCIDIATYHSRNDVDRTKHTSNHES